MFELDTKLYAEYNNKLIEVGRFIQRFHSYNEAVTKIETLMTLDGFIIDGKSNEEIIKFVGSEKH